MRPLPVSGVVQRESGTFFVPFPYFHRFVSLKSTTKMKNQTILAAQAVKESAVSAWLSRENKFFSCVLEETVSNRQTLLMGHAAASFSVLVCSAFLSPVSALVCLGWFGASLHLCKKGGLR